MTSIINNNLKFNSNIKFNFQGGDLKSDAGIIVIKEFDEKIGFSKTIKENFKVTQDDAIRVHTNSDLVIQRIFQSILGYHTNDDLRKEPLLTKVLGKNVLASQLTMSRLKDRVTEENIEQLEFINYSLLDKIYSISKPKHLIL